MNEAVWLAAGATTVGTLLIRMLPLFWMQRRRRRRAVTTGPETAMPIWPRVLAPLMIAALLGLSLVPHDVSAAGWGATMMGSIVTLLVWCKMRTLGLPVAAGIAVYALVFLIGS
ncbi:hypothetical protein GCM10010082_04250 [Kushneria pakistanensis]|uniref:Branched-chain amino acid ABC transporter n=1 Tax=Kushneria pakistanensis TaxID=1508770 RepID=A0ABQ3FAY7_9GAMM|nr:AzlD domain-containing protein [Kushneria pakistanensis]GHC16508.1 hypothetical protein GCM10010082_04250 [Kushneria pakistanensis]